MAYIQKLSYYFQDYFAAQLIRGLTLFVEATTEDLFAYMQAVITFGANADGNVYREYAHQRLLSSRNARIRLREGIQFVLDKFMKDEIVGCRVPVSSTQRLKYYLHEIRDRNGYRLIVSHLIFDLIRNCGHFGAEKEEMKAYLRESIEYPEGRKVKQIDRFHKAILNRLVRTHCLAEGAEDDLLYYKLNFNI